MSTAPGPLRIPLGELTSRLGVQVPVQREVELAVPAVAGTEVDPDRPVRLDLAVEAITGGVVAAGTVTVPWRGECRRCVERVDGETVVPVREVFESRPTDGETYPLGSEVLDLEPMVRDAVLLALPLAPVCGDDCRGPDPERFPTGESDGDEDLEAPRDPRWAALDVLRGDAPGSGGGSAGADQ